MNPLADWLVDVEAIAEHQRRLRESVSYRAALSATAAAVPPAPVSRIGSSWATRTWRALTAALAPIPAAGACGTGVGRRVAKRRCA
jgi:hypothetical protein